MKANIHPTYFKNATITCSCGNVIITGSTLEKYTTELCSNCHPFYTGKQKTVDSAGRIERFQAKLKKAQEIPQISKKKSRLRKSMEEKVNEELQKQLDKERKEEAKLMAKVKKGSTKEE